MILDFLNNPLILLAIASPILLFLGIILGNFFSQPRKNKVLKVSPESKRGVELEVKSEDAVNVYCDPVGNMPPQRFIKRLHAFNIIKKGWFKVHSYALWFGRYGTAYVHTLGDENIKISFKDAVFNVFGLKYWKQIPRAIKNQIESGQIGVMIQFPKNPLTPMGADNKSLPSISEDDINRDSDKRAMRNLWDTWKDVEKGKVVTIVAWVGTGIAIGIIVSLIFKWGAPIIVSPAST